MRSRASCYSLACVMFWLNVGHAQEKISDWGEFINPAGDCKVREENGVVSINVPGGHHNLNPLPDYNLLAPRLVQPVSGDFQVDVKVLKFARPEKNTSASKTKVSYVAAGLVIWQDDKTFLRAMRAANAERGDLFIHVEAFRQGDVAKGNYFIKKIEERLIPDEPIHFRAERKGNDLTVSHSPDGKEWKLFSRHRISGLKTELLVGVAAVNSTNREFAAQFAGFKLAK